MHNLLRTRALIGTGAMTLGLLVPVLAAAPSASAKGGDAVIARAACTNGGHVKLKAKHDDGRIEVELEVDSNRVGQRWAVRIRDNGALVVKRRATTAGRSGSFSVEKKIANRQGPDRIRARATFGNRTCAVALTL